MNKNIVYLVLILLSLFFVYGAGEASDVPATSVVWPTASSTVQHWDGVLNVTATQTIPSGDADSNLVNSTLYINFTRYLNQSEFTNQVEQITWSSNSSININGTSNTTQFQKLEFKEDEVSVSNESHNFSVESGEIDETWIRFRQVNETSGLKILSVNVKVNGTEIASGNYTVNTTQGTLTLDNSSDYLATYQSTYNLTYTFTTDYIVNIKVRTCNQQGNCSFSANKSFTVDTDFDTSVTSATIDDPANGTVISRSIPYLNFTVRDDNYIQNVTLFFNYSTYDFRGNRYNYTYENITFAENETMSNTGALTPFHTNTNNQTIIGNFTEWGESADDGFYYIRIKVCDYNNNCEYSDNYTFEKDTTVPVPYVFLNVSVSNTCTSVKLNWTSNEPTNITIDYGIDASVNDTTSSATFTNSTNEINLTNLESNQIYYWNLTACDEHGNCNKSVDQFTFLKEWSACSGWNAYGVLVTDSTLGDIANNITNNATTVSWFNQTSQTFTNYVVGLSPNSEWKVNRGESVMVQTSANSFVRLGGFMKSGNTTITDSPVKIDNWTNGNWTSFGMLNDWALGNMSALTMIRGNITFFTKYDNERQRYTDYIYGRLTNNESVANEGDAMWVWQNKMPAWWYRNTTYLNQTEALGWGE